jgi:hypothetical protein
LIRVEQVGQDKVPHALQMVLREKMCEAQCQPNTVQGGEGKRCDGGLTEKHP